MPERGDWRSPKAEGIWSEIYFRVIRAKWEKQNPKYNNSALSVSDCLIFLTGCFYRQSAAGWAEFAVAGPGRVRRHVAQFSEIVDFCLRTSTRFYNKNLRSCLASERLVSGRGTMSQGNLPTILWLSLPFDTPEGAWQLSWQIFASFDRLCSGSPFWGAYPASLSTNE